MWAQHGNNSRMEPVPFVNTIGGGVSKAVQEGYSECFKVTSRGLYAITRSRYYRPEQVQIVNVFRFDGQADGGNNATLYLIETSDGLKGTLVDTGGIYNDPGVQQFIAKAEEIRAQIARHNQQAS